MSPPASRTDCRRCESLRAPKIEPELDSPRKSLQTESARSSPSPKSAFKSATFTLLQLEAAADRYFEQRVHDQRSGLILLWSEAAYPACGARDHEMNGRMTTISGSCGKPFCGSASSGVVERDVHSRFRYFA